MTPEPAPSPPFKVPKWVWIFPFLAAMGLFALILGWVLFVKAVPDSGVELGYRIAVPESQRTAILKDLAEAAKRRLDALGITGADSRIEGDVLLLRLPGATPETSARVKRLFGSRGLLELSPVATVPVQEAYNKDQTVPEGYRVVDNTDRARGDEYGAYGSRILVRKEPVIRSGHIVNAEPRNEMTTAGKHWVTTFELNAEGAKLFDDAAAGLYEQRPNGLIAILLDGVLKSAPAVRSPVFHGRGQISGTKTQEEAEDLAVVLRSGALPLKLGEPEFERPFGPPKK